MKLLIPAFLLSTALAFAQGAPQMPLAVYNSSPPTISNGKFTPLQADVNGNLLVAFTGSAGNGAASATGSAVPAQADYQGLNVGGGTLRGQTGVNPSGSIYAAQVDIASVAGTTLDTNSGNKSAGTVRMVLATDQPNLTSALNVSAVESGTWNVGLSAGTNWIGYTQPKNGCGTTAYEAGYQYLPTTSTAVTSTATCVTAVYFNNKDTSNHVVSLQDQSTGCSSGICAVLTSFLIPPGGFVRLPFDGTKFTGGLKWNTDASATAVVGNVIGNQ